jgi:hypothetical protein
MTAGGVKRDRKSFFSDEQRAFSPDICFFMHVPVKKEPGSGMTSPFIAAVSDECRVSGGTQSQENGNDAGNGWDLVGLSGNAGARTRAGGAFKQGDDLGPWC